MKKTYDFDHFIKNYEHIIKVNDSIVLMKNIWNLSTLLLRNNSSMCVCACVNQWTLEGRERKSTCSGQKFRELRICWLLATSLRPPSLSIYRFVFRFRAQVLVRVPAVFYQFTQVFSPAPHRKTKMVCFIKLHEIFYNRNEKLSVNEKTGNQSICF